MTSQRTGTGTVVGTLRAVDGKAVVRMEDHFDTDVELERQYAVGIDHNRDTPTAERLVDPVGVVLASPDAQDVVALEHVVKEFSP